MTGQGDEDAAGADGARPELRAEGAVFLGYYIAYMAFVVLTSQRHESVATFALVMQTVVLPLTILTLLIVTARAWKARKSA